MLFNCKPADDIDNRHIELSIEPDTELVIDQAFDTIKDSTIEGKMVGCRTNKKPNLVLGKVIIEDASIINEPEIQLLSRAHLKTPKI